MESYSIVEALGYNGSSCGYCAPPGQRSAQESSKAYGGWAHRLTPQFYQSLIDCGWRRSGKYLYKPDLTPQRSCCPHYTIRCDSTSFKASKSQRQVANRFVSFIQHGKSVSHQVGDESATKDKVGEEATPSFSAQFPTVAEPKSMPLDLKIQRPKKPGDEDTASNTSLPKDGPSPGKKKQEQGRNPKSKPPQNHVFSLTQTFKEAERSSETDKHRLKIKLEPASFTEEKFQLYYKYQTTIHNEDEHGTNRPGFVRFLCHNPFTSQHKFKPTESLPDGGYHMMYYLDDELIAFGVVDLLPHGVSSVYLVWDPAWASLGLGKVAALREIELTHQLGKQWYYMGYYIHSCPKMRYKGDYSASFLLDAVTYNWFPLADCKKKLELARWVIFSDDSTSTVPLQNKQDRLTAATSQDWPDPSPLGCWDPCNLPQAVLDETLVMDSSGEVSHLTQLDINHNEEDITKVKQGVAAVGPANATNTVIWLLT